MSPDLDRTDRALINAFQGGFPAVERPFESAAEALRAGGVDVAAEAVVERVRRLDAEDSISRFGPLVDTEAISGTTTLVAMAVPAERFDAVAETVNDVPEVAHNYERDHQLNMWFVLTIPASGDREAILADIEAETGLSTYDLPKRREFYLGARFPVEGPFEAAGIDLTEPAPMDTDADGDRTESNGHLTDAEYDLLVAVQDGLPITDTPYADLAADLDVDSAWVRASLRRLRAGGVVRRIGVVPNHYAIGYTDNGMTVWDVPDDAVAEVGEAVGALPFVTHCYERPRHEDVWPYNLFAMVHGRNAAECEARIERVRETIDEPVSLAPEDWDVLYSTRILKKEGLRLSERNAEDSLGG